VDIVLLTETKLHPTKSWRLPGYEIIRNDREPQPPEYTVAGGTAVLLRTDLKGHEVTLDGVSPLDVTAVNLDTPSGPFQVAAVYHRPGTDFPAPSYAALFRPGLPALIGGDFNAKHLTWNSSTPNRRGEKLRTWLDEKEIRALGPRQPTHYHFTGSADVLDIFLLTGFNMSISCTTVAALESDHLPVLLHLGLKPQRLPPPMHRNFKKADWTAYRHRIIELLPSSPPPLDTADNIDHSSPYISHRLRIIHLHPPHPPPSPRLPNPSHFHHQTHPQEKRSSAEAPEKP
jgi:hypothetical protein